MFLSDTICAISTPPGVGGIAVIRLSGPQALEIADKLWHGRRLTSCATHTAHFGIITDPETPGDQPLDQAVATIFRGPNSFTGDDIVEISVHGSLYIQRQLLNLLIRQGARMAQPGEFTRRAFANGRLDLAQAEAVADVIASGSRSAHALAMSQLDGSFSSRLDDLRKQLLELASLLELELDFSEEDVEFADRQRLTSLAQTTLQAVTSLADTFATGDAVRRGIPTAIVGPPNAGKSSLLNTLLGRDRAIVSDIPGTTRDTLEETLDIHGLTFRLIDTAGLHHTTDTVEALGIARTRQNIASARLVLWLSPLPEAEVPPAPTLTPSSTPDSTPSSSTPDSIPSSSTTILPTSSSQTHIILYTKADLAPSATLPPKPHWANHQIAISSLTGQGLDDLRNLLASAGAPALAGQDTVIVTNVRHYQALRSAADALYRVLSGLGSQTPTDLVAQDLRDALSALASITGAITTPQILQNIFSHFCVGK